MGTLIINFKNFTEALGERSVRLAKTAEKVSRELGADIIVSPPNPMLATVAAAVGIQVFSQTVQEFFGEQSTGAMAPEAVKAAGASGTILNHSENRIAPKVVMRLAPRLEGLGLKVCLCARTSAEAVSFAGLGTTFLAIEPPELIGTGVAVSKAKPDIVRRTVDLARAAGYEGTVLCGAGIVTKDDVRRALELGAGGVLVASSIVKSKDWSGKITSMASELKRSARKL